MAIFNSYFDITRGYLGFEHKSTSTFFVPNQNDSSTKRPYPGPGFFKPGRALSATFRLSWDEVEIGGEKFSENLRGKW